MQEIAPGEPLTQVLTALEVPSQSHYRARYYDPSVGRFLAEDPIAFRGGPNKYLYVRNQPLLFSDPFGRCPCGPKYWTNMGDPDNPIWKRVGMLGRGLGNGVIAAAKIGFAAGVEIGSGGLATPFALYAGVTSAGNLTAGTLQIMGAFMPNMCPWDKAADTVGVFTSISGLYTIIRGGGLETAARRAGWEGMLTGAFQAGVLGEALKLHDAYDIGMSGADALKKNSEKKEDCGCQ